MLAHGRSARQRLFSFHGKFHPHDIAQNSRRDRMERIRGEEGIVRLRQANFPPSRRAFENSCKWRERNLLIANSDLPEFNASIGGVEIVFLVDTGSDGSIAIPESAFDRLEKLGFIEVSPIQMKTQSLNRIRDSRRGWFLEGELMGMPLRGMDVVSSARKPSTPLGLIWLSSFNFELDRQKNTMRFEQRSNPPLPRQSDDAGAVLIYDEEGAMVFEDSTRWRRTVREGRAESWRSDCEVWRTGSVRNRPSETSAN